MAVHLVLGDIIELKVGTFCLNQAGINVLHYRVAVPDVNITLDEVAQAFDVELAPKMKAVIAANATYYGTRAQIIHPTPVSVAFVSATAVGPGTLGNGNAMPTQVSGVATKLTDVAGRKYRGRMYLPFPGEIDDDGTTSTPTAGYVTDAEAVASFLLDPVAGIVGLGAVELTPIIWHRSTSTWNEITSWRVNDKWGTQRRRGAYGQANTYPPF